MVGAIAGVIVVDKPAGRTSAGVVAAVKKALGGAKVGHTGTLDPMATGVLPLCIGEATKIAGYLLAEDKAYEGTLELGVETDTLDADGVVTGGDAGRAAVVTSDALRAAAAALTGELDQVPPMYSAIHQDGKRLHQLARRGETVERKPRAVRVDRFDVTRFEAPTASFEIACSKGTYVRAMVRDLGRALGCGAMLTGLRRTLAGRFTLADAVALEDVDDDLVRERAIGLASALVHLPAVEAGYAAERVCCGRPMAWSELTDRTLPPGPIRIVQNNSELLALAEWRDGQIHYLRVFNSVLT